MLTEYYQAENNQEDDILLYLEKKAKSMKPSEDKLQECDPKNFNLIKFKDHLVRI